MSDSDSDGFDPQELVIAQELQRQAKGESAPKPEKAQFFNKEGIESCIKQIALPSDFHWIESLTVTTAEPFVLENLNDDLKRESLFYEETLAGVKTALARMDEAGIPYQRPTDFYAEMVKPDSHMNRVKDALLREKKKMAVVQNRKQQREQQKMAKQVQAERIKQKGAGKREAKATLEALKAKKGRNQTEMRVPRTMLTASLKEKQAMVEASKKPTKNRKRQAADKKYGFGGKKKRLKSNTAESLDDAPFPVRQNKSRGPNTKRIKMSKGQKRPGKKARHKARS